MTTNASPINISAGAWSPSLPTCGPAAYAYGKIEKTARYVRWRSSKLPDSKPTIQACVLGRSPQKRPVMLRGFEWEI